MQPQKGAPDLCACMYGGCAPPAWREQDLPLFITRTSTARLLATAWDIFYILGYVQLRGCARAAPRARAAVQYIALARGAPPAGVGDGRPSSKGGGVRPRSAVTCAVTEAARDAPIAAVALCISASTSPRAAAAPRPPPPPLRVGDSAIDAARDAPMAAAACRMISLTGEWFPPPLLPLAP